MKRVLYPLSLLWCLEVLFGGIAGAQAQDQAEPLLCYVGGTMRPAVEKLAEAYKAKTGEQPLLDFGDSGELFIKAEQARKGDVLVVHDPYLGAAINKGLADQGYLAAGLTGVIVVPEGNPKAVQGIADLAKPGMRLILTDAEYSTLGHIVTVMGKKSGLSDKLEANCVTRTRSGGEAANAVSLGTADAGIVWNAVAFLRKDKLDAVPIEKDFQPVPGVDAVTSATFGPIDMASIRVTAITLTCSKQVERARAFAAFLASPESAATWKDLGYTPMEGGLIPRGNHR